MYEDDWMREFSDNLRAMMREQGYTQRGLADAAGIGESTMSRYLSGTVIPKATALVNIAYALDCTLDDLMDFNERITM